MKNSFYNEFDLKRLKPSSREGDYRTPFQIDRDRIIYSSEFRRLQGKTQVFLPREYDFYRTRLTHSIEVAQIGRSICNYLQATEKDIFSGEYYIDPDLVEAVCLAHDLGHPPFGHAGERIINNLMKPYGGFEGNAQTLRILTEIFYRYEDSKRGMNPTRAFLDGILKYKTLHKQLDNPSNHFIYNEQKEFLDFVFPDKDITKKLSAGKELNSFRSIECQIMDWADDTAYAINDIVDSIIAGFITITKLIKWQRESGSELTPEENKYIEEIIEWIKSGNFKPKFGSLIGEFIHACRLKETNNFMSKETNRYKYNLVIDSEVLQRAKCYKKISNDLVFHSAELHQMEFKGKLMLDNLFNILEKNYINNLKDDKLFPNFTDQLIRKVEDKNERARLVCDYISGMTDNFALRIYKRLFDPDYSILTDFI